MTACRAAALAVLISATGCEARRASPPGSGAADPAAAGGAASPATAPPVPPDAVRITGKNFHVDAAPAAPCHRGEACTANLHLTALGGFKVNKDYPFKFVPSPSPDVDHDGHGFRTYGDTLGVLTVRFRTAATGPVTVDGTFKLSVCDDEVCQIETPAVAVQVPVR